MQGCLLVDSHKSTGSGPVRSPASCPSKKSTKHKTQPETKETKQTTKKTQPQPNQNKQNTEKWDRYQQWEFMHDDILCVIMRMAPNKKQNKETTEKHQGPGQRV